MPDRSEDPPACPQCKADAHVHEYGAGWQCGECSLLFTDLGHGVFIAGPTDASQL